MERLFLAGCALALMGAAHASASTLWLIDATGSHSAAGGGTDWVNLNNDTTFDVVDNSGKATNTDLQVFLAVPTYDTKAPSVTGDLFNDKGTNNTFTLTKLKGTFTSGNIYDFALTPPCGTNCNNSTSFGNFNAALTMDGLEKAAGFTVYDLDISVDFPKTTGSVKDFEDITGLFPKGTIVVAFSKDNSTFFDTAFTNAGVVNVGPTSTVPEPSTWAMLATGFGLMGLAGWRKAKRGVAVKVAAPL
jgi:hypothetical protein